MSAQENINLLTLAGPSLGWVDPDGGQPSTIVITIGASSSTYYHQNFTSPIELWYGAASQASAELDANVVPHFSTTGILQIEAPEAFTITIGTDEAATKLGFDSSGTKLSGSAVDGAFRIAPGLAPPNTQTMQAGHGNVTGFERSWSGGKSTADASASRPAINIPGPITVRFLQTWEHGYQYLETWEEEGYLGFYDVSIGSNYIVRGAVESVTLTRAGTLPLYCFVELKLAPAGLS